MMKKENATGHTITEDFYEDFGNNLTRIQILSEILERKIRPADIEGKQLIGQIKEYQASLWLGIRDLLWALSHTSPTLGEVVTRLSYIGTEIFKGDGSAVFILENNITKPGSILRPNDCLNILIIFKEVMLACSNYPDVSFIRLSAESSTSGEIILRLLNTADYTLHQHLEKKLDLLHIEKCANRLRASFSIDYSVDEIVICRLAFYPSE